MSDKSSTSVISFDRLHTFSSELRIQSPQWADRLEQVRTEQDLGDLICDLFNLSHTIIPERHPAPKSHPLPARITAFVNENLHRGLTLKVLANFLGYSEKYCSDLFCRIMGEPFSKYLRRQRVDRARALLTTTRHTLAEIASALGFSDQFAFSHFFKRATGQSPMTIRLTIARQHRRTIQSFQESPYGGTQ
ncbi:MAG: HTH araC/xylS-type domain-containing protein [Nitrospira sp.]|nr:MAG: HTH araC/xylS-type domain-containing protein [Nitrospira sp.]